MTQASNDAWNFRRMHVLYTPAIMESCCATALHGVALGSATKGSNPLPHRKAALAAAARRCALQRAALLQEQRHERGAPPGHGLQALRHLLQARHVRRLQAAPRTAEAGRRVREPELGQQARQGRGWRGRLRQRLAE